MKHKWRLILALIPVLLVLFGCSISYQSEDENMGMGMDSDMRMMSEEDIAQMTSEERAQVQDELGLSLGEKIIENAYLSYETTDFDSSVEFVQDQIEEFNGMLEHTSRSQAQTMPRYSGNFISMTIRIPQDQLHDFIDQVNAYDSLYILSQEIGQTDVTKVYRDNETRINILREEETALREMLQEQGTLEEILLIRTRLSEVVAEREIYENENQNYDEQVEYSTVTLDIRQTDRAGNRDVSGFWDRLSNAFGDAFYSFISVMQQLVINLVYLFPYLIILLILGVIGFYIWKKFKK